MILDGTIIEADRCREPVISVKGEVIDLWYSGKAHRHGGNIQAVLTPGGFPLWASEVEPGSVHDLPVPEPSEGQVRIRVAAVGLNPFDHYVVQGGLQGRMEHRFPLVPGADASGTVEALGQGVGAWGVGDEVFGSVGKMHLGEGTLAEFATMSTGTIARGSIGLLLFLQSVYDFRSPLNSGWGAGALLPILAGALIVAGATLALARPERAAAVPVAAAEKV